MKPTKKPHLIAHRGWSARFPENSIPAFAGAIAAGADEIEFDVRVSEDGIPFVIHDSTIDRTTDGSGRVDELTAAQLGQVNLKDATGEPLIGLGIPTLHQVLLSFTGQVGLNIHIKGMDQRCTPLHLISSITPPRNCSFYIAGNQEVLAAALETCPHIPRCFIQGRKDTDMGKVFQIAQELRCERIQFFKGYYEVQDLQACLDLGFITNLYWADEPGEAEQGFENGVIGLLTNEIGLLRKHLLKRNLVP